MNHHPLVIQFKYHSTILTNHTDKTIRRQTRIYRKQFIHCKNRHIDENHIQLTEKIQRIIRLEKLSVYMQFAREDVFSDSSQQQFGKVKSQAGAS